MTTKRPREPLDAYRAKRRPETTPEPFAGTAGPGLFVVHKHAARRLHWDLRLETSGVLRSWAVPHGPSPDPAEKRFAAEVEDHPAGYADFEGVIPAGNYGAGAMIVWDRGRWVPLEDPVGGYEKGKLLFELHGYKLRGVWSLVRMKGKPREWLLIKHADAHARPVPAGFPEESVLSGLTVEELREGPRRAADLRAALAAAGAPRRRVDLARLSPMLAEAADAPFSASGWLFEPKCDGYRLLAGREGGAATLRTRGGLDVTATFPEVAAAVRALPVEGLLLDGELVVLDAEGRPSFPRLQGRAQLKRSSDVARASLSRPASYWVFDLLAAEGNDARGLPLAVRKELLRGILPRAGPVRYLDHVEESGEALFEEVVRRGLEGVVAKRADSPYRAGRSPAWKKVRRERTGDFAVVGTTAPRGTRAGLGALHLAAFGGTRELVYAGSVGSGFTLRQLEAVARDLSRDRRATPACAGPVPREEGTTWVEPRRVAEVRFKERTPDGLLRHPVFVRFRDDKSPADCVLEAPSGLPEEEPEAVPAAPEPPERKVVLTRAGKVFWPREGYTKGDLIAYYEAVAPWLLPYLKDRPVVLTRYPDGVDGKSFFQKDAPAFTPGWLRTERMWSGEGEREIDAFVCDDVESLLFLANLGTIPLHVWASRVASIGRPDWCVLDLDPKGAPFDHVVRIARAAHALCDRIGLPSFVKTSGSTGLHVLLPLGGLCTFDEARALGELLARVLSLRLPDIATVERLPSARGGRVYVDFLQNGRAKLLAAPFSVRPLPGAPVSTPLSWGEVTGRLDAGAFTLKSVPRRMARRKADPLLPVLTLVPDLGAALARLSEDLSRGG